VEIIHKLVKIIPRQLECIYMGGDHGSFFLGQHSPLPSKWEWFPPEIHQLALIPPSLCRQKKHTVGMLLASILSIISFLSHVNWYSEHNSRCICRILKWSLSLAVGIGCDGFVTLHLALAAMAVGAQCLVDREKKMLPSGPSCVAN
jgi:hypothetical protein